MDLRQYWTKVRQIEQSFPTGAVSIFVISIDNETTGITAGTVSEAPREYAARFIASGNCMLATPEQIAGYRNDLRRRTDSINRYELEKKQTVRLETAIPQGQLEDAIESALSKPKRPNPKNAEQA